MRSWSRRPAARAWPGPRCCAASGFGAASRIHTSRILALSEDLPLVIEIVDTAEKVEAFLAAVDDMLTEGLVTMERVQVRAYRARPTNQ